MNPKKDVEAVAETRLWMTKVMSAWAITQSKIVESKFQNHMPNSYHRKEVYNFQVYPIKDVEGVAEKVYS